MELVELDKMLRVQEVPSSNLGSPTNVNMLSGSYVASPSQPICATLVAPMFNKTAEAAGCEWSPGGARRAQVLEGYFSFAYSVFAAIRIGMSGSAPFQSVKKS